MTEQAARALAATLGASAAGPMPSSRAWGVLVERAEGRFAAIEDHGGWVYRDRAAYDAYHRDGDQDGVLDAREWGEWDGGEKWAEGLSEVLGSGEYWQSGGGIHLVFYPRPDGKFAVIGDESGSVYETREQFEADEYGEKAESFVFV